VASASHLAELGVEATNVATAWKALEPVVARQAESLGTPGAKSDYHVGQPDSESSVAGADLDDCLDRVDNPTSISVTYTASNGPDIEPTSIELRIMRHRRFKELDVKVRITGPGDIRTLGLFDRTEKALAAAIRGFDEA
jgi:hypothetical protein